MIIGNNKKRMSTYFHSFENGVLHNATGLAYVFDSKNSRHEKHYVNGQLHSEINGQILPSLLIYKKVDNELVLVHREYHRNGYSHSYVINGKLEPSVWYPNRECYHIDGLLGRFDGPAVINYDKNGNVTDESWYLGGLIHSNGIDPSYKSATKLMWHTRGLLDRLDGPASINLEKGVYIYYNEGVIHRTDGPALISTLNGETSETWYNKGKVYYREIGDKKMHYDGKKLHNKHGPAITCEGEEPVYALHGKILSREEWCMKTRKY